MHAFPSPTVLRGTPPPEHRGHCARCGVEHVVRNQPDVALQALEQFFHDLDHAPRLAEFRAALDPSRGKMFGVLVGVDPDGARHVLHAMSGDVGGRETWDGLVPPVTPRAPTAEMAAEALVRITALTDELPLAEPARALVIKHERRAISAALMSAMFDSVVLCSGDGVELPLRQVFVGKGMPSGTGECAVPKLLHAANRRRIRPVALGEAWWGPTQNGRHHGDVQHPCAQKCTPILGHLLCGWHRVP